MAKFVGSLREINIEKESVRGTAESPSSGTFLRHMGHSVMPMVDRVEHQGADGTIAQYHESKIVHEYTQGSIPFYLERGNAWLVGAGICGQNPSSTGSGTYTHAYTFDSDNNTHQSFTLNYTDPTEGDMASPLAMMNTFNMTVAHDQYISCESEFIADKSASATFTPSYEATPSFFKPSQATFKVATNYAGLGAASATEVASWNIAVSKNVAPYWVDGSTQPAEMINQRTDIRGEINLLYDSTTFSALGVSDNTRALQMTLSDGTYGLTIELPNVYWIDPSRDTEADSFNTITLGFVATNADATNGLILVDVIDDVATH